MLNNSERLVFRPYTDEYFDFLLSLLSNPEVIRFIGHGKTRDIKGGKEFLNWIYRTYEYGNNMGLRLLVDKERQRLIGHAGLVPQNIEGEEEVEIGYWIAREHWGKGYATEAAKALLAYGKQHLHQQRFIALIQPNNLASINVAKKLGMVLEKQIILGGQDVDLFATQGQKT